MRNARTRAWAVVAPTLLFAVLALTSMTHRPLWRDEAATREFAIVPLSQMWKAVQDVDLILAPYYTLMHLTTWIPGWTAGLRLPSVLAGIACVAFISLAVREQFGAWPAFTSGMFLATNASFLLTATTARPYAIAAALLAAAAWVGARGGRLRWWTLFTSLAVVTQLFSVLAVTWLACALIQRHGWRHALKAAIVPHLLACAILAISTRQSGQVSWIEALPIRKFIEFEARDLAVASTLALCVFVLIAGLTLLVRRQVSWPWLCWLATATVPAVTLWLISIMVVPVYVPRYAVFSKPATAALLGACVGVVLPAIRSVTWRNAVAATAVGVLCLNNAPQVIDGYSSTSGIYYTRDLASALERKVRVGDVVIYTANPASGGLIYGLALYAHDTELQDDLLRGLPTRKGAIVSARRVESTSPMRTAATTSLAPHVWIVPTGELRGIAAHALKTCTRVAVHPVGNSREGIIRIKELACP